MSSPPRPCRICAKPFQPSRFHPSQTASGDAACQKQRRAESRAKKLAADAEYRDVCRDSARKWRAAHPDYWKQYRARNPEAATRNRERQRQRDERQRLLDLANNNLAPTKVVILQRVPRKPAALAASCKQHPSGANTPSCPTTEKERRTAPVDPTPAPLANSC